MRKLGLFQKAGSDAERSIDFDRSVNVVLVQYSPQQGLSKSQISFEIGFVEQKVFHN